MKNAFNLSQNASDFVANDFFKYSSSNITLMPHQWIHGNLDMLQSCNVCGQFCGSDGLYDLRGWRCMWCGNQVHESCLKECRNISCKLGPHKQLLLPPTCLRRLPIQKVTIRQKLKKYLPKKGLVVQHPEEAHNETQVSSFSELVFPLNMNAATAPAQGQNRSFLFWPTEKIPINWKKYSAMQWFKNATKLYHNKTETLQDNLEPVFNPENLSSLEIQRDIQKDPTELIQTLAEQEKYMSVKEIQFSRSIKKITKKGERKGKYLQRYEIITDLLPAYSSPLLVLINSKSGGQQGKAVLQRFKRLLHPFQVWDIANVGPAPLLTFFREVPRLKILVAGGDGTVGWILQEVEKVFSSSSRRPPVAILPLGTGNDLARMLKWGGGYTGGKLDDVLQAVQSAHPIELDRWNVNVTNSKGKERKSLIMNNYIGIGIDGELAMDFHETRIAKPRMFINRFVNKAVYGTLGFRRFLSDSHGLLAEKADIYCDGKLLELPPGTKGLICLNINSYAGGCKLWEEKNNGNGQRPGKGSSRSSLKDQLLEIVAIQGLYHLGAIQVGLVPHATKIAQCHSISVHTKGAIPIQVDGEPWREEQQCKIDIWHRNQALMLERTVDVDGEWLGRFENIMIWAEKENLLTEFKANVILREAIRRWSHL